MNELYVAVCAAGILLVVGRALFARGRIFAIFAFILLGIPSLISMGLFPFMGAFKPLVIYLQLAASLHLFSLSSPRLRSVPYRALVSIPGSFFVAGSFLALPWGLVAAFGFEPYAIILPYAAGAFGVYQSLTRREERVPLVLDGEDVGSIKRLKRREGPEGAPLRLLQITDPHLGPFMSVAQLKGVAQRAVDANPDLILLTGDFLTMESSATPGALAEALAPLQAMSGKTFACLGNHDHEAPEEVRRGLAVNGIRLLVDDAVVVETARGKVQIVGADFVYRDRSAHLQALCAAHPRVADALRLVLLHDPWAFGDLPEGEGDLVLSGHTHGGQVGLVSLGLDLTFISAFFKGRPDHGWWGKGRNRLYVHRGTGHYGFPLRVGVPGEESVLEVYQPSALV